MAARDRCERRWRGTIGRAAYLHSTKKNMTRVTPPRTRRTMITGDDQGNVDPPLEMGTRMNIVDISIRMLPRKSTFLSFDLNDPVTGLRGRKKMIWIIARALTGTVTQKTHLHCKLDNAEKIEYRCLLSEDSTEERTDRRTSSYAHADIRHHLE